VLTVSFDKADTPETAAEFVRKVGIPEELRAGWRHAVAKNRQTDVEALAGSVGFRFFWSNADKTFLHPNVLVFLTPEGRVARYLYGTRLDARAIQLALIDADWGRIAEGASVIDMLTGVCFSYNYAEGRYQPNYPLLIGIGSLLFGLSLTAFGAFVFRRKLGRTPHAQ
jgi:protein SCO1/2